MTVTLNTSRSENTMVLSARVFACMYFLVFVISCELVYFRRKTHGIVKFEQKEGWGSWFMNNNEIFPNEMSIAIDFFKLSKLAVDTCNQD
jgi:hypothetical protein